MPSCLAECDSGQYIDMCGLLFRYQSQQINYEGLRVQAVYRLLNLVPSGKELLPDEQENKWGNMYQVSELIDTFFDDVDGQKVLKVDYAGNPVQRFRPLWRWYYGPTDYFTSLKFGEYLDLLRIFGQFHQTPSEGLLRNMAAIMYRKQKPLLWLQKLLPGYDGDVRRAYNPNSMEKRLNAFKYAPIGMVYGCYLQFAAFQKFIATARLPWGGQEIDLSILFESDGDWVEAVPGIGMDGVAFALAESGQLGTYDKVKETPLWDVLVLLYNLKKNDLDRKANEKKNDKP